MFELIDGKVTFIDNYISIEEKKTYKWLLFGKLYSNIPIPCPGDCGLNVTLVEGDNFNCKEQNIKVEDGFVYITHWE